MHHATAPRRSGSLSIYLDPFRARLLQQFDRPRVRCFLTSAVVPGQVAASGATRQLVAQLLSRHRVLQGGTAKTEAGRRCETTERRGVGGADKEGKMNKEISIHFVLFLRLSVMQIVCERSDWHKTKNINK